MIPEHGETVRRPDDDEVVGYLVPAGDADAVPTSLVGTALGSTQPASAARSVLVRQGLRAVDRRWWCRLPAVLPPGLLEAAPPDETGSGDPSCWSRSVRTAPVCGPSGPRRRS